jgi:hypothetical protein
MLAQFTEVTRPVASELLGDLAGGWTNAPECQAGIIQPGAHELRRFSPAL